MERFSSEAPAVRLVAFSTLDTWLSRALDWCSRGRAQGSEEAARLMLGMFGRTLPALANQIFWHWEHTNRKGRFTACLPSCCRLEPTMKLRGILRDSLGSLICACSAGGDPVGVRATGAAA